MSSRCTYEADDIIGTLARRASEAGEPVIILTGDRDAFQLVDDRVSVMATGRGVTDTTLYTPDAVRERYKIGPELMVDFRGMVGDPSDNLKGVPGIGEKGAATLLQKYGSLDEILAHAEEQTPKRRESLIEHADTARQTREMARIDTDAPVAIDLDDVPPLDFGSERMDALREMFSLLQFDTLSRRLGDIADGAGDADAADAPSASVHEVRAVGAVPDDLSLRFAGAESVAVALTDDRWAVAGDGAEVAVGDLGDGDAARLGAALTSLPVACHDAKAVVRATGDRVTPVHDTMIAAYLLEPRRRDYVLDDLAADIGVGLTGDDDPAAQAAVRVREVAAHQRVGLHRDGLEDLYRDIELPVTRVLAAIEEAGVRLDVHRLGEITARVRDSAEGLRNEIWELAGGEFTIESPKQLGQVLFERLGLPTFRKGKTGWSTDRRVLRLLEDKHPIVPLIGRYRELTKLDNTYLSALPELVGPDVRIHTTFNQTVAETGRLSSTNPNLQNIPVRTPLGREIRDAFIAEDGWVLVSCDYSQVELRILAHCSKEPVLTEAFRRGEDVHRATAAEVFGMAPADVDRETRDRAKAVNFGIVYGISDFGLSEQLGIPRAEAGEYITAYLDRYPRVRNFIDTTIAAAAQDGYVRTLLGRRRPIPELGGRTVQQRQLGERLAVNTVVQGTAADIIKAAMVRAHDALRDAGLRSRIILQIHDELLIEAPEDEAKKATAIVRDAMVGAYDLDPPLAVETGTGHSWLDAKA